MKLVINIPCYNEEKTLPLVLRELPRSLQGISAIEVQIVDDGSSDKTVDVARRLGVDRIIRHKRNLGLGAAFKSGADAALAAGADIMVNMDGDNAFPAKYLPALVAPILNDKADLVVGNRTPWKVKQYSFVKRFFQYIGNGFTRELAGVRVPDTVCGYRAYSREALLRLNITTQFSYVLDTLVQAGRKGMQIVSVPIRVNPPTRRSRLFRNIFVHMYRSGRNIVRLYIVYEPFRTFAGLSFVFFIPAVALVVRFLILYQFVGGSHLQSLLLAAVFAIFGGVTIGLGFLAELSGTNRRLAEEQLYLQRKYHYEK